MSSGAARQVDVAGAGHVSINGGPAVNSYVSALPGVVVYVTQHQKSRSVFVPDVDLIARRIRVVERGHGVDPQCLHRLAHAVDLARSHDTDVIGWDGRAAGARGIGAVNTDVVGAAGEGNPAEPVAPPRIGDQGLDRTIQGSLGDVGRARVRGAGQLGYGQIGTAVLEHTQAADDDSHGCQDQHRGRRRWVVV